MFTLPKLAFAFADLSGRLRFGVVLALLQAATFKHDGSIANIPAVHFTESLREVAGVEQGDEAVAASLARLLVANNASASEGAVLAEVASEYFISGFGAEVADEDAVVGVRPVGEGVIAPLSASSGAQGFVLPAALLVGRDEIRVGGGRTGGMIGWSVGRNGDVGSDEAGSGLRQLDLVLLVGGNVWLGRRLGEGLGGVLEWVGWLIRL